MSDIVQHDNDPGGARKTFQEAFDDVKGSWAAAVWEIVDDKVVMRVLTTCSFPNNGMLTATGQLVQGFNNHINNAQNVAEPDPLPLAVLNTLKPFVFHPSKIEGEE